ncbi:MAG: DUF3316 domain-containing protein [Tannerella sp.]|jgi:hypothetical protein|nr:DUF3316 domain-containing protein [Tannerella sp.]
MKNFRILCACLVCLSGSLAAQTNAEETPYSVNEGTMIGFGGYNIKNSYLSFGDDIKYTGKGVHVLNERMRMIHPRVSSQQMFHVDLSLCKNPAATISAMSGIVDYSHGYHYRFEPVPGLKLLAGTSLRGMLGIVYNTQTGNNPTAINADIDLNLSVAGIYTLRLRNYPLTLRYQVEAPLVGVLFSPNYGQSYYEIFGLGNMSDVIKCSSLHNKQALRNYLTVDFPVWTFTVRTGYLNNLYYTHVNKINVHHVSHSFTIGLVKEFIAFRGKQLKKKHLYQSAYY